LTTCEEIYELLKTKDLEKIKVEFKQSDVLRSGQKNLAKELVALANHSGGKLILGLKDNGDLEGNNIFDVDKDKGTINSIIQTRISPIIKYNIEYLQCPEGELLIIHVEKKKDMPHAYIASKDGYEIKNRIYYIKTPHDKRLISDSQLKYLFQEEEINIFYPFEIMLNLTIPDLKFSYFDPNRSAGLRFLEWDLLDKITPEISKQILSESDKIHSFFQEIIPYAILLSFSKNFYRSWQFTIYPYGRRYSKPNIPMDKITLQEIPNLPDNSLVSEFSLNIKEILNNYSFNDICVPHGTEIQLGFEVGAFPIIIKNKNFEFKIFHDIFHYGTHLESRHSSFYNIIERDGELNDRKNLFINLNCVFEANFIFPDEYDELYNFYVEYAKNIKTILMDEWDFNVFLEKYPNPILFSIDKKLDQILKSKR